MINQPSLVDQSILTNQEKMVKGSAWMTASNVISRILGAIYIIPWYVWMGGHGNEANSLFSMGCTIYALFLMISTAGIPGAIAKQTSHYNSLNEYKVSRQLFYRALQLMGGLGVVSVIVMYLASPALTALSSGGPELVPTMRSLSPAVLVSPSMSVIRDYFQGNQEMMPFALSQIVEQVARVFHMLLTAFVIMKVFESNYITVVTQATFATFIGMLTSFAVLGYYMCKQKPLFDYLEEHNANEHEITPKGLLIEILKEAIPFIVVGSGVTISKLVNQFTFSNFMRLFTDYSDTQLRELSGIFNANPGKLTTIVVALATSISAIGLPLITEAVTLKNHHELARLVSNNLQLFVFVMLPVTFGMIVLAQPLYAVFYMSDVLGTSLLVQVCYASLFLGSHMLVSDMLMGMYENHDAMRYLGIGLAVKLIVQFPVIRLFEVYGPLLAMMIGFTVSCVFILRRIRQVTRFNYKLTLRRTLLMFCITVIMMIIVLIFRQFLHLFLDLTRRFQAFIIVVIVATVGDAFYGYSVLKIRLADRLLGKNAAKLHVKFSIK